MGPTHFRLRADSDASIGAGHVIRSLATPRLVCLEEAMRFSGDSCSLSIRSGQVKHSLRDLYGPQTDCTHANSMRCLASARLETSSAGQHWHGRWLKVLLGVRDYRHPASR